MSLKAKFCSYEKEKVLKQTREVEITKHKLEMLTNASKGLSLTRNKNAHIENYISKVKSLMRDLHPRKLKKDKSEQNIASSHSHHLFRLIGFLTVDWVLSKNFLPID